MIHPNALSSLLLFITATPITVQNDYVQYGFLGILLSILIWYSRVSWKENVRREKENEKEKTEMIERYEKLLKEERERYHIIHLELLAFFKSYKQDASN